MCRVGLGSKHSFDDSASIQYNVELWFFCTEKLEPRIVFVPCGSLLLKWQIVDCGLLCVRILG